MDTKKLRQKILDLAIHGKLVPQDPNDEPASVLLERIKAEKERLIKEGKIKRSKKSAKTSDTPYYQQNVPKGWCLTNIGELLVNRDGERKPISSAIRSKQMNKIYDYYGAAGVIDKVDNYLFDERLLLIGEDGANLLSRSKNNAFFAEGKYWVNNHAHVLDATDKKVLDFVAMVINSMKLDDYITGSAQPKLSQDNLNKIPIILPPLSEQQRIIAETERWFSFIDQIEQDKSYLQTIIKQAKSTILNLAIHGKLVPQDPNDESAAELLKRINPKAEITCDNGHSEKFPFDIPDTWVWCNHNSILDISGGAQPAKSYFETTPKPNYIRLYQIRDYGDSPMPIYIPINLASKQTEKGDILLARYGGSLGKVFHAEKGAYNVAMAKVIFKFDNIIYKEFAYYYYLSDIYQGKLKEISRTAQAGFNSNDFNDMYFPLPPLSEQLRIVAKIEKLFSVLGNIQKTLEA